MPFVEEQQKAFDGVTAATEDNNSFITGEAGSGKSYLTEALKNYDPITTVLTGTTGQASQLIGGRTLHSFIGLLPYKGLIAPRFVEDRIQACERLIIDEVSMLSNITFDLMMSRFEDLNHFPQLIMIGDFLQLRPVDKDNYNPGIRHTFAFKSRYWRNIRIYMLRQQHRQSDPQFVGALNDMRIGHYSGRARMLVRSRTVNRLPDDCTQLFPLRAEVKRVNQDYINRLTTRQSHYVASEWKKDPGENVEFRFEDKLYMKEGARIIMLNNDPNGRWVNGSPGVVKYCQEKPDRMEVALNHGYEGPVERITECCYDGDGTVKATLTQFPCTLAAAITIHKAQGTTLKRVGIGMSNFFDYAMMYVALSRAMTREDLFLIGSGSVSPVAHPEALAFYERIRMNNEI